MPVGVRVPAGGEAPLTLGQRNVLRWLGADPRADVLPAFVEVPPGRTTAELADALGVLLARHEALRTVFAGAVQRVLSEGGLDLEVHPLVGDPWEFVGALVWRLMAEPLDVATRLPLRAVAVTRDGAPFMLVLLLSHAAVDAAAAAIVGRQCAALLAGEPLPDGPGHQPRDQAGWERSPGGRRRTRASLRHWDAVLRRVPQALFVVPHPDGTPGHRELRMRSAALAAALPAVLARTGASGSTVLLAAAVVQVAARTGTPAGALVSICGNRFRGDWRDYVGPLAQDALVPFSVVGADDFDEVVRGVQGATMSAYRYAQFDSVELWEVIDAVGRERGTHFHRDCVVNDVGAYADVPADVVAPDPLPATTLEPLPDRALPTAFLLTLGGVTGAEVDLRLHADTGYLPGTGVEDVLLGIEQLVVRAAAGPVPLPAPDPPAPPGSDWVRVQGCLVSLAAVRALLPPGPALVAVEDGRLVAYVAGGPDRTPASLHAGCLAGLPGHPAAMAPQHYVVRATAPADPSDPAAWRRLPALHAGPAPPAPPAG